MSISRYANSPILSFGRQLGTSSSVATIRAAIKSGEIPMKTIVLRGNERLDTIAGEAYGDGTLWWVIAAASDIGWGLQIAPGTVINIPNLDSIMSFLV